MTRRPGDESYRFWPFGLKAAIVSALVLVPVVVALVTWMFRPGGPLGTPLTFPILLLAILVGLAPILLVVLGGVTSLEAGGVKVAFAAVQEAVQSNGLIQARSIISENLGLPPGTVPDTNRDTILDTLKKAVGNQAVVVDLKEGQEWWETRLLVLAAGAARHGSPAVIVFTDTVPDQPLHLLGWATPSELLRRLLACEPEYRRVFRMAQQQDLRWQLSEPSGTLPWPRAGAMTEFGTVPATLSRLGKQSDNHTVFPWPSPAPDSAAIPRPQDAGFEAERFLLDSVIGLELPGIGGGPKALTPTRLNELFDPVLHRESVEETSSAQDWLNAILSSTSDFIAVTHRGQFRNLVPRRVGVNAVLLSLSTNAS